MVWANSKIFRKFFEDKLKNAVAFNLGTDAFKAALYNNSITPDVDATTATLTTYNGAASQWLVANEVSQAVQWPAGGVALTTPVVNVGTSAVCFWSAANTASGSAATLAAVFGCLNYDTTVASQGVCYNYFGGTNSVTNGTFTIVWNANGIFRLTL